MTRRLELPPQLRGSVFTRQHASALGVSRSRLRASDLQRYEHGLYAPVGVVPAELAQATALRFIAPETWLSHASAARHHGLWLPAHLRGDGLHLSRPTFGGRRKTQGVRGHQIHVLEGEVDDVGAVLGAPSDLSGRVSSPTRAWLDLAASLDHDWLVVIGDQLVRAPDPRSGRIQRATVADLLALLDAHRGAPGARRARQALALIRDGADSAPETLLRLALIRAGFPEPELQILLDPTLPPGDMGYRSKKVVLQYEGEHHRSREQFSRDIRRDLPWVHCGWTPYRYDAQDLREGFQRAIHDMRRVFAGA